VLHTGAFRHHAVAVASSHASPPSLTTCSLQHRLVILVS